MGAFGKLFCVLLRNEFRLKPKGRRASRVVSDFLRQRGFPFRSVEVWMGFAEPAGLSCLVFFEHDAELARFEAAGLTHTVSTLFCDALTRTGYPTDAVPQVDVSFHSDETIDRSGGYLYWR